MGRGADILLVPSLFEPCGLTQVCVRVCCFLLSVYGMVGRGECMREGGKEQACCWCPPFLSPTAASPCFQCLRPLACCPRLLFSVMQMIALRYGTVPIVRSTGGLADTVKDVDNHQVRHASFLDVFLSFFFLRSLLSSLLVCLLRVLAWARFLGSSAYGTNCVCRVTLKRRMDTCLLVSNRVPKLSLAAVPAGVLLLGVSHVQGDPEEKNGYVFDGIDAGSLNSGKHQSPAVARLLLLPCRRCCHAAL